MVLQQIDLIHIENIAVRLRENAGDKLSLPALL